MRIEKFVELHPKLYHMAECDSWPSIAEKGLLSTSAALDLHDVRGKLRSELEDRHRDEKVVVGTDGNAITLRDQKPMFPARLQQALINGCTPSQWYRLLNGKVFMWADRSRLLRLLNAREYRNNTHDVLTIDTASLLSRHLSDIWLCHMNSGNTFPIPHVRDVSIFHRVSDYPCRPNGSPIKRIVEVVRDHAILDIASHVTCVVQMRGTEVLRTVR